MPRPLYQEQGLLAEDVLQIAFREPEAYRRWCITTHYALRHVDPLQPLLVSRTHTEVHDGEELLFALLVLRRRPDQGTGVQFSEIALSPGLYAELVRDIGVRRPLPQEAPVPEDWDLTPEEAEDRRWAELLGRPLHHEDDGEIPF